MSNIAILPSHGSATVKAVLSGDTVILLGSAKAPNQAPPEVTFTFEKVSAPRLASKGNGFVDEPGAFPSREFLREKVIGKVVKFETKKQGANAGDRVYGILHFEGENLAVESVRAGHAVPKITDAPKKQNEEAEEAEVDVYAEELAKAFEAAQRTNVGVHSKNPLIRKVKNANEGDFDLNSLVKAVQTSASAKVKCLIEYVFDGSRLRVSVTDESEHLREFQHGAFTLYLGGITSPRLGNPRLEPPTEDEPFARQARAFVDLRLLHRELDVSLHGCPDNIVGGAVGTIHHPRGDIAVFLLEQGLARIAEWSLRILLHAPKGAASSVMVLRKSEGKAKQAKINIWKAYQEPTLSGVKSFSGKVVEVVSGDTLLVLPDGVSYDSEDRLRKLSLASIRAPRIGNENMGRLDEPYASECKDRLRVLTAGKEVNITVNYERDIPLGNETESRQFATITVGKKGDVGEILLNEGLATTQRHRDDDEKSSRYDELMLAEATAKAGKKGVHNPAQYKKKNVNDLLEPRKAKSYSGALMRAGPMKAIVEFVFNGSRLKVFIPSENCSVAFALANVRCPQPTSQNQRDQRSAEPFGDESRRFSRLNLLQKTVEIRATGVTNSGVITGQLSTIKGGQKSDYSLQLLREGLAYIDERLVENEAAPKDLMDAQNNAKAANLGLWTSFRPVEIKETAVRKSGERSGTVRLSEIRSGNHFFVTVDQSAVEVIEESMKTFTSKNGTNGAPCDVRKNKVVAALFDDGSGKSWNRAKILGKANEPGKVSVLFIDYGNVASVSIKSDLRPLDDALETTKIPAVAKEAVLALVNCRGLNEDIGVEAATILQEKGWGKVLNARIFCETEGKLVVSLCDVNDSESINEKIVSAGVGRIVKSSEIEVLADKMTDASGLKQLAEALNTSQEYAKRSRLGMFRYGDVTEDDDEGY